MFTFKSLHEFNDHFRDEISCYRFLESEWWKDSKPVCPHCGSMKTPYSVKARGKQKDVPSYRCSEKLCDLPFTIKTGSIFEGTKVEMRKWFQAIYEIGISKKGISSIELSDRISVSQKTAWLMLHKIRNFISQEDEPFDGITEIDETFVGGKNKNRHRDKKVPHSTGRTFIDKTPVLGMLNLNSNKVKLHVVKDTSSLSLSPYIVTSINFDSVVFTDEWRGYNSLDNLYLRKVVDHGRGQYVNDGVTTNRIENFWSIFKRGLIGIYQSVSRKHLQRYCNEFSMRFNLKSKSLSERFLYIINATIRSKVTYKELTYNLVKW